MVDWNTNEAGTVHRAEVAVRCSRFIRLVKITEAYPECESPWLVTLYAVTDMDATINQGLSRSKHYIGATFCDSLAEAKKKAEEWLQH